MVQRQRKAAIIAGFATGAVLLAALTLYETRRSGRIGDGIVFNSTTLMAAIAAVVLALLLSAFPRTRRQRFFVPRWFLAIFVVRLAGFLALGLLVGATVLAWLVHGDTAAWLLRAAVNLMVWFAFAGIFATSGLRLHRFLRTATPPEPPPAAH